LNAEEQNIVSLIVGMHGSSGRARRDSDNGTSKWWKKLSMTWYWNSIRTTELQWNDLSRKASRIRMHAATWVKRFSTSKYSTPGKVNQLTDSIV
jgi:hypothetical protein